MIRKAFYVTLKKKWFIFFLLILSTILIVALELIPPIILKEIINTYLDGLNENLSMLFTLAILYVVFLIFSLLFDFIKQLLLIILGEEFTKEIRIKMAYKLKAIEASYFTDEDSGVTTSRFTTDVDQISSFFTDGIISMVIDLLKIVAILITMFLYSLSLGMITLIAIPVIFIISFSFKHFMKNAQKKSRVMIGYLNNQISDTIKNERMIQIYAKEEYLIKKNTDALIENYKAQRMVSFFDSSYSPLIQIITAIVIVIVVILSKKSTYLGISIGTIALAIEYITNLFTPIEGVGMEIQSIQKSISGLERVKEFLNRKDMEPKLDINDLSFMDKEVSIDFKNVTFSYNGTTNVLNQINLTLTGNQNVAISGRTGVGKTTLFKLIEGEIKPTKGFLKISGIDSYLLKDEIKHKIFGYVSQDYHPLNEESIYHNITMKNKDISEEDVVLALKTVGIYDKIKSYPKGIDTMYKDISFSNGEKQLLNIARAIVANPKILLLDEMTSGLDSITEGYVMEAIKKASLGRMILQISHRLSTTLYSDFVIYMENGSIKDIIPSEQFVHEAWVKNALVMEQEWDINRKEIIS